MPIVVDASIMACWHFEDEHNDEADAILNRVEADEAIVPQLWWFEMRNALLNGERRRRTTAQQTAAFLEFLREVPISVALLPDENAVINLARRHRLSFYDAAYLELAKREGYPLATFDHDLIRAAKAERVPLA